MTAWNEFIRERGLRVLPVVATGLTAGLVQPAAASETVPAGPPAAIHQLSHCDCDGWGPRQPARACIARPSPNKLFGQERYCPGCGSSPDRCNRRPRLVARPAAPVPMHAYSPGVIGSPVDPHGGAKAGSQPDVWDLTPARQTDAEADYRLPEQAPAGTRIVTPQPEDLAEPELPPATPIDRIDAAEPIEPDPSAPAVPEQRVDDAPAMSEDDILMQPAANQPAATQREDANADAASSAAANDGEAEQNRPGDGQGSKKQGKKKQRKANRKPIASPQSLTAPPSGNPNVVNLPASGWRPAGETRTAANDRFFETGEPDLHLPGFGPGKPFGLNQ